MEEPRESLIFDITSKLRMKYDPKSVDDVKKIAMEEYGVGFIEKTNAVWTSKAAVYDKGTPILYNSSFKPYEALALAHELGHVALHGRHQKIKIKSTRVAEIEADAFACGLLGVSPNRMYFYRMIDGVLGIPTGISMPFVKKGELEKLRNKGLQNTVLQYL